MPDHTVPTPGVYVSEVSTFSNTIESVPTAIPAFIGYPPKAEKDGISYINKVHKVGSFIEFNEIYGVTAPRLYSILPNYYLKEVEEEPLDGNFVQIGLAYYHMIADPLTQYYFYQSVKLFFENGGTEAYIVATGTYGEPTQNIQQIGETTVNSNVVLNDLLNGLGLLKNEMNPTMYICPEATLLSLEENGTLMKAMLLQQSEMQTGICIFDIIGSKYPDPLLYMDSVTIFRENTGSIGLSYGVAYYPFLKTTLTHRGDILFKNFFGGDLDALDALLHMDLGGNTNLDTALGDIANPNATQTDSQKNEALLRVSPLYRELVDLATKMVNLVPPSGAMAGVIAMKDTTDGVWTSPANVSIAGVHEVAIDLSDDDQAQLTIDSFSGKSINAIRSFQGKGILVWGARTLDGNSGDWKYISVRRTMLFIEQSCKLATSAYVFEPNNTTTWLSVKMMISDFMEKLYRDGALQGTTASQAYRVDCGLGTTMTAQDIALGHMVVFIKVALVRPDEFIVLNFTQQMALSS